MQRIKLPFDIGETVYWSGDPPPRPLTVTAYRHNPLNPNMLEMQTEPGGWWTYWPEQFSREPRVQATRVLPRLIAFCGPSGAGKSTAAMAIRAAVTNAEILSIAEPIKKMVDAMSPAIAECSKEASHPALCGRTKRHALQTLGTEWGRNCIGEDIWINIWRERAEEVWAASPSRLILVDDLRYLHEERVIRELGGKIVRVFSPRVSRPHCDPFYEHPSERDWRTMAWNRSFNNDYASKEEWADRVRIALAEWLS